MPTRSYGREFLPVGLLILLVGFASLARAGDRAQWGQRHSRNMVSGETGLPEGFNPERGENVKWSAPLGTE